MATRNRLVAAPKEPVAPAAAPVAPAVADTTAADLAAATTAAVDTTKPADATAAVVDATKPADATAAVVDATKPADATAAVAVATATAMAYPYLFRDQERFVSAELMSNNDILTHCEGGAMYISRAVHDNCADLLDGEMLTEPLSTTNTTNPVCKEAGEALMALGDSSSYSNNLSAVATFVERCNADPDIIAAPAQPITTTAPSVVGSGSTQ